MLCTRLVIVGGECGYTRFPVAGDGVEHSYVLGNAHGCVGKLVQDGRVTARDAHFDGIAHEHEVVAFEPQVGVGMLCRKALLQFVDVGFQIACRLEVNDEFAITERGQGDGAYQVVASRATADRSGHMLHIVEFHEFLADVLEVGLHTHGVVALWQFVFHVELVVLHVGEERLGQGKVTRPLSTTSSPLADLLL